MKLFLTAAALAALLSTGAYAQDSSESRAAPSGQVKETTKEQPAGAGMSTSTPRASGGGAMSGQTTGSGDTKKDNAGSKDNPGQKTGVSGGSSN